ncbi:MAG: UPF0182 family protein [Gemmatimonadetes bacterium]|nr:UPF0182 family protein [Gemmatimonadota bacterium]
MPTLPGGRALLTIVIVVAVVVGFGRLASTMYVEILWHAQTGYSDVFWLRVLWQWGVRVVAGVAIGALVFLNLRIMSETLGGIQIKRRFGNLEISEQLPRSYVLWGMGGASALLALWFGGSIPQTLGLQLLLIRHAEAWGIVEPMLNHDVGFYVFWVPVLLQIVAYALVVVFLVFTLATAGYAATGALRWGRGRLEAQDPARMHLGVLLALFLILIGARLWLSRYELILDGTSDVRGIFGFTDAEARLPALQTLTIICVVSGVAVFWGAWKNRGAAIVSALVAVVLAMLMIGQLYPSLIQSLRVEPNELERETPFIESNLEFTRMGFGLDQMERRPFEYAQDEEIDWSVAARQFSGLPVWNRGPLLATYRELEARYPYYDFRDVTIDRYETADGPVTVAMSVREVEPRGIQDPNWQNVHLRELYVEGMGVVASLASQRTPEGRPPMLISGIPPESTTDAFAIPGLSLNRSQVFFGTRAQEYAVVDGGSGQFLAPNGERGVPGTDFPAGIELGGWLRTALIAWRFGELNLIFSDELTDDSRFIYRRQVTERVLAIAPFLRFPEVPYPVVLDGRVVWMLEGFTATGAFPLSTVHQFGTIRSRVRYARNSVKVTVDAVTGEVDFYRVPIDDPLLDAYERVFPGLLQPLEEMPDEMRAHIRYSRAMLDLQSRVLLQYHQETAPAFHGQQDVWDSPQELAQGPNPVPYQPEYGLYALPGESEARFHLTTVFVPRDRQNLTAILAARTDERGVPELILYDVPVTDQVPGPRQIEALVEQDPEISQQFSLWRTGGSEVWTGHLHLVSVGKRIVYMEPVFLAAEADAIPALSRFVVSDGVRVAMTENLADAISELAGLTVPVPATDTAVPTLDASAGGDVVWSSTALALLERAEASARAGDWQGYGEALDELRALLQRMGSGGAF